MSDGEGSGTPLQHSCLENPMDGGAWWAGLQSMGSLGVGHDLQEAGNILFLDLGFHYKDVHFIIYN